MKNTLEDLIANDTSYNKSITRYLYKTHPELWKEVVDATSFLPDNAMPKQRIWHILNGVYDIQLCPVTGAPLQWKEKEYKKFSSIKAKNEAIGEIISKATTGNHWRHKDPKKAKKANKKFSDGFRDGKHKPWSARNRNYDSSLAASKKTWMEKYGVDNPSKCPVIQRKLSKAATDRYSHIDRAELEKYYLLVIAATKKSWKLEFHRINPDGLQRSKDLHLDHIYSIAEGFKNNIPPEIIGHWTNLRLLSKIDNSSKGAECHKTIEQLYEDYEREISS